LNNKPIRSFVERYGLKQHLRPLPESGGLRLAVALRGELYRRLCATIWDRQALGFPSAPDKPETATPATTPREPVALRSARVPAPRKPAGRPTDIQLMIRKGVLTPGTRIVGSIDGTDAIAHIQSDGQLKLKTGDLFRKPDDAARAVTGKRSEGMLFWQVTRPDGTRISLRQLRDQAKQQLAKARH
jgi:Restriction Enzyme Adenine Methylase Associated